MAKDASTLLKCLSGVFRATSMPTFLPKYTPNANLRLTGRPTALRPTAARFLCCPHHRRPALARRHRRRRRRGTPGARGLRRRTGAFKKKWLRTSCSSTFSTISNRSSSVRSDWVLFLLFGVCSVREGGRGISLMVCVMIHGHERGQEWMECFFLPPICCCYVGVGLGWLRAALTLPQNPSSFIFHALARQPAPPPVCPSR